MFNVGRTELHVRRTLVKPLDSSDKDPMSTMVGEETELAVMVSSVNL